MKPEAGAERAGWVPTPHILEHLDFRVQSFQLLIVLTFEVFRSSGLRVSLVDASPGRVRPRRRRGGVRVVLVVWLLLLLLLVVGAAVFVVVSCCC